MRRRWLFRCRGGHDRSSGHVIIKEGFKLPDDGLYSGFDPEKQVYNKATWNYEEGSDMYLQIRAGADIAFLGGVINYAIQNNRIAHDYLNQLHQRGIHHDPAVGHCTASEC